MLKLNAVIGYAHEPAFAERLHALAHRGGIETVTLSDQDMARRRLHLRTDRGTEIALLLDRDAELRNGAILALSATAAIVVALDDPRWLVLAVDDAADALALGYFAGNMHWKVRFDGTRLAIRIEGERADLLKRLAPLLSDRRIVVEPDGAAPGAGAIEPAPGHGHHASHPH
ncbi:MAG: urease accessory protein UreE [Burkholderiaceae bacterium]